MATGHRDTARWTAGAVAAVAAYLALALAGRELGGFGPLSLWFPPAGLAIVAALFLGWAALLPLAVAEFLSGVLVFGVGDDFSVLQMVLNALAYAAVWTLAGVVLRGRGVVAPITDVRRTVEAFLVGLAAAPAAAALVGVGMRTWAGSPSPRSAWADVAIWWVGDAIGVLTLAPALLLAVVAVRRPSVLGREALPRGAATLALLAAPTVVAAVVVGAVPGATGLLYVVAVPLVVTALRLGTIGVAIATVPLSTVLTWLANRSIETLQLGRTDVQVLLLGVLVTGWLVAVPTDQGRQLRQRLQRREHALDEAQRLAAMGSFHWDTRTDAVRWSAGLSRLYGRPEGEAPRGVEDYLAAIRADHREEVGAAVARVAAGGGPVQHRYPITRADGAERWVTARVEAVRDADGVVRGLAGYCQDVTDQQRVEEVHHEAVERERAAAARLAQVERIKDALLVAVSHEVRTPLTVVSGMVATLGRAEVQADPELVGPLVERLAHHVARLDSVLTDLLDTDRLRRGAIVPRQRPTNLQEVVDSVLTFHDLSSHDVEVEVDVPTAVVDPGLLGRMLEGLLVNALRYTPDSTPVGVRLDRDDEDLLLTVSDRGPGVPADQHQTIFEPFHQGSQFDHAPGTGMGLYLVARFAELHGGTARVEDVPGGGAAFHVRLPDAVGEGYRISRGV